MPSSLSLVTPWRYLLRGDARVMSEVPQLEHPWREGLGDVHFHHPSIPSALFLDSAAPFASLNLCERERT